MTTLSQNLLDLSDFAWQRLRGRVEGMTDEEYLWEPFDGSWSIRKTDAGFVADGAWIAPEPAPFTTLGWRITHIVDILQAERTATWFGHQPAAEDGTPPVPGTADEARAALDHAYDVWRRRLASLSQDDLDRPIGPIAGMWSESDGTSFALHILDELIHHGAEVGAVRDFYRGEHPEDLFTGQFAPTERPALLAEAAAAQRWDVIPQLAAQGFDVNARTKDGFTAAHLAAGNGALDTLKFLVNHGADLSAKDPRFNADALGWANWFQQPETAKYLESL